MQVVYAKEPVPEKITKSVFLAGPTPRSNNVQSWRPEAIRYFEEFGYDGVIFIPESRNEFYGDYIDQIDWEEKCLQIADCILFWIPRDMTTMPALTTNNEWGVWCDSGKVVLGAPTTAVKVRYQKHYAQQLKVPFSDSLIDTVKSAINMVGKGAERIGGEKKVPLYIWNTPHFQNWYQAQKKAGNRLDGAKVVWTFRVGPECKFVFFWALHVDIYISSEKRHKTNEVVLSRPDISTVVMYQKNSSNILDSTIVLIREFRSPVANENCFVYEVPGGSSFKHGGNPKKLAADECKEETGLIVDPERIEYLNCRQMVSTLSAHKAHLFAVEITDEELTWLKSQEGIAHGVEEDTEKTYVEITSPDSILKGDQVDWAMLGMIFSALH